MCHSQERNYILETPTYIKVLITIFGVVYVLGIVFVAVSCARHPDAGAPPPGFVIQRPPALVPAR